MAAPKWARELFLELLEEHTKKRGRRDQQGPQKEGRWSKKPPLHIQNHQRTNSFEIQHISHDVDNSTCKENFNHQEAKNYGRTTDVLAVALIGTLFRREKYCRMCSGSV